MLHASDVYKRIAGVTGCVSKRLIHIGKDEREKAINYLQNAGFSSQSRIAVFQPGAAVGAKRWDPKNFVELGKMLIDDGYKLLVTGAPAEGKQQNLSCFRLDKDAIHLQESKFQGDNSTG
jgi:ADP-heptose:LPS heptosyltransferase